MAYRLGTCAFDDELPTRVKPKVLGRDGGGKYRSVAQLRDKSNALNNNSCSSDLFRPIL